MQVLYAPRTQMLVTFVRHGIGGISTIWKSVAGDDKRVLIIWYQPDNRYYIDSISVFHFDIFAPKARTFHLLKEYLDSLKVDPSVFIANEEFDLEFLNWVRPSNPIAYIAHVNGDHSYKAAIRFKGIIDYFYTVAAPAVSYLTCRGLSPVEQIDYSITLPDLQLFQKEDTIVYLGRFACDKNIKETATHLEFFRSKGFRSIWVGNGPEEGEIRRISKCEVITDITRGDLYQLLAKTKYLLLNSYYEGLPVILFECVHFHIVPILSYVDSSCNEILRGSFVLASRDPITTFTSSLSANPTFPSSHPRINNSFINQELVSKLLSVSVRHNFKSFRSDASVFDRVQSRLPASLLASVRKARWQFPRRK